MKNKINKSELFNSISINTHFSRDYPDTSERNRVSNKFSFAIYPRFKDEEARNVTNNRREQLVLEEYLLRKLEHCLATIDA